MSEMAPQATAAETSPDHGSKALGDLRLGRRQLMVGGGLAGVGGALGLGYRLRERPAEALSGDRTRAAHLLRRAGFAASAVEVDHAVKDGLSATTDRLLHPERSADSALLTRLAGDTFDTTVAADVRQMWMVRMAATERPLQEKMTLFWHGILTSSFRKAGKASDLMYNQNQFLRDHALGKLRDLLVGISKDGAMLKWLDGTGSGKAHPNENYARELMELFTLGVGNYTETDVREGARALTGYYVDRNNQVQFRAAAHDAGSKTFLGRTGNWGLEDVIDIILANPAAPTHLSRRMWEFFAYPSPTNADLQPLVDAFHHSDGDVRAMLAALFQSPAFYSQKAYRGLVKSPTELNVGLARQFGLPIDITAANAGEPMGQALLDPPNVAGWPGGADWLSTGTWMARVRFINRLTLQRQAVLAAHFAAAGAAHPDQVSDRAIAIMVDDNLSDGARKAVREHARATGQAGDGTAVAREVVYLVAATPEYQLA
ncbi:MAG: DUF1800 domain-containing protein [Candidatus Dormibacteria bacterium]